MAGLSDTNILVYRFDPHIPDKQERATSLLRREFVAAVTRPIAQGPSLLSTDDAYREVEDMLSEIR